VSDDTRPINGIRGVREATGDGPEFESYRMLMKATRGFLRVARTYHLSPSGSTEERAAAQVLDRMREGMRDNPGKTIELATTLASIIIHMELGGTLDEWFEGVDDE
jgi:hypothetical protein